MMMKKKSLLSVISALICVFMLGSISVSAEKEPRLCDTASLLSASEKENVQSALDRISEAQEVDIVILTVDTIGSKSAMRYADDYYDEHGYGMGQNADGLLLLISMEESEWYISTTGYCIRAFTNRGLEYMSDRFVPYLSDGEYEQAFIKFAELCDEFLTQARTGDPYDSHNLPKDPFDASSSLIISLFVGIIAAVIATGVMKGKLNTVRAQTRAQEYVVGGSLNITRSRDFFLYRTINRRPRPKDSGSSAHRSSSGRSHGGGGGRF